MITIRQDALLLNLLGALEARYIPRSDDRRTWAMLDRALALELIERAERAKELRLAPLKASEYASDGYKRAYISRAEALKALVLGTCCQGTDSFGPAMTDLIYDICSQPDWSLCPSDDGVADYTNSTKDVCACETGALLALTASLCETSLNAVSPKVVSFISHTLKARLLDPLINWEGVRWVTDGADEARAVAALVTASLMGETDDRRRWLCLRRALSLLESCVRRLPEDGGFAEGLENHMRTALALDDCFSLLSLATAGEVELRDENQFAAMAKSVVDAHVDGEWFVNPNGDSPKPQLDTDALYRLGMDARLGSVCELAAYLRRLRGDDARLPRDFSVPTPPLFQQIMNAFGRGDLIRQSARVEKPAFVFKRDMRFLASRIDGIYVSLTGCAGGGIYAPATGDFTLFADDKPEIITYPSPEPRFSSVPTIGGNDQVRGAAKDLDFQQGLGYSMLSLDISAAYPKKAGVISWQRTIMTFESEKSARLMDVFDLDSAQSVAFRFIFGSQPRVGAGLVETPALTMQFDAELSVRVERLSPDGANCVHRLELYSPSPVRNGNYSFVFRRKAGSR